MEGVCHDKFCSKDRSSRFTNILPKNWLHTDSQTDRQTDRHDRVHYQLPLTL